MTEEMQNNAKHKETKLKLLGLFLFLFCGLKPQLVRGSKQTFWTIYPNNRIKLLSKVHIEYIVEATNIILRVVSHIKS